jgi:hypothetical protein
MDKSWPAADRPHWNAILDVHCACFRVSRLIARRTAPIHIGEIANKNDCQLLQLQRHAPRTPVDAFDIVRFVSVENAADCRASGPLRLDIL